MLASGQALLVERRLLQPHTREQAFGSSPDDEEDERKRRNIKRSSPPPTTRRCLSRFATSMGRESPEEQPNDEIEAAFLEMCDEHERGEEEEPDDEETFLEMCDKYE